MGHLPASEQCHLLPGLTVPLPSNLHHDDSILDPLTRSLVRALGQLANPVTSDESDPNANTRGSRMPIPDSCAPDWSRDAF